MKRAREAQMAHTYEKHHEKTDTHLLHNCLSENL